LIHEKANAAIASTNGYVTIPGPFESPIKFDWSIPSEPLVNSTSHMLTAGIKGQVISEATGADSFKEVANYIPWYNETMTQKFQLGVTSYTADSLLRALVDSNPNLFLNLTYEFLHVKENTVYLDTSLVNFAFPGIL
jgi:hypothetical protein